MIAEYATKHILSEQRKVPLFHCSFLQNKHTASRHPLSVVVCRLLFLHGIRTIYESWTELSEIEQSFQKNHKFPEWFLTLLRFPVKWFYQLHMKTEDAVFRESRFNTRFF